MTKQGLEILLEHVTTWPEEAQEETRAVPRGY
jgi:hypothetical protein